MVGGVVGGVAVFIHYKAVTSSIPDSDQLYCDMNMISHPKYIRELDECDSV